MATIWLPSIGPPNAATYEGSSQLGGTHFGADGDIWVRRSGPLTGQQQRFRSAANGGPSWTIIVQPQVPSGETRADVLPLGGQSNDVLTKAVDDPFGSVWQNAAGSIVQQFVLDPAAPDPRVTISGADNNVFLLSHGLGSPSGVVDVTVISTTNMDREVPKLDFPGPQECILTFSEDITPAIAVVRR